MTQQNSLAMTVIVTTLWLLSFVVLIPTNELHAAVASTRVAIIKIASLTVEKLDTDHLYQHEGDSKMTSTACLRAGGDSIPFRISATSFNNLKFFSMTSRDTGEHVPYQVIWSNGDDSYTLKNQRDITDVQQVGTKRSCELNSVSVVIDDKMYSIASNGRYVDTLSLILVIE